MRSTEGSYLLSLLLTSVLVSGVCSIKLSICDSYVQATCNAEENMWVLPETVVGKDCSSRSPCDSKQSDEILQLFKSRCVNVSECSFSPTNGCGAEATYTCIQGVASTPRPVNTAGPNADAWEKDYGSWQWAILWIMIGVVSVALIILIIMLINRGCFKALNQEKPKFIEGTPTHSNIGSTMNSRSVSMSTLHRPPPPKKEVSQEELEEIRTQFGTAKKNKDKNMKHFGVGINSTLDSRRSSGDGASGEANGKLYPGDDSSSGIGSVTYDSRIKHGMYDDTDTCHDDYVSYTMKKQAKSPLVNPQAYGTLQNSKRVDEDLYRKEAPTVDICEDRREENFRMDINSWTLNKHGQQVRRADPAGASTVSVQIESAGSDIQLNPGNDQWMLHDHQHIKTVKSKRNHHRMNSIISIGSENLGYIPENDTIFTIPTPRSARAHVSDSDYSTLSPAEQSNDNLYKSPSTSSAKELKLDLSDLDISLSSDQFSFRKPTRTKTFYEAFSTPRSQSMDYLNSPDDSFTSAPDGVPLQEVNRALRYSYPNIALPSQASQPPSRPSSSRSSKPDTRKYVKHGDKSSSTSSQLFSQGLPLPMNYGGAERELWSSNKSSEEAPSSKRINKKRGGKSRVNYLTQLKLGETVRLHEEKKKKKRVDPKGTIHYSFKSDFLVNY